VLGLLCLISETRDNDDALRVIGFSCDCGVTANRDPEDSGDEVDGNDLVSDVLLNLSCTV
jgi:hypothetical protein